MDAFCSTFLPKFHVPTINDTPIVSQLPPQQLHIFSVRVEEKPHSSSNSSISTILSPKPSMMVNAVSDIVNSFRDPPLSPSFDPKLVLSGNFAPVDELPPTDCEVIQGTLPICLNGAYIRNGPNPQHLPRGRPYHLFDGDGMVHCVRISDGRATLILTGQYNPSKGIGVANTSLALIGNRLFALGESDLPYAIRLTSNGDIDTSGRHDFDGKLFRSMTAHPKVDPDTGETFAFSYDLIRRPYLSYFYVDANGNKRPDVPIFSLATPSFIHDFAITKKYAIFCDMQIGINPMKMIFGMGSPVSSNLTKPPRIGIIPRYAKDESEMKWLDAPGFNPVHVINAWDEDDGNVIVMVAPNILSVEHMMERMDLVHAQVEKVRIDLKTGLVTRQSISTRNLDMAVINPAYVAKRNKYVYAALGDPMPKICGVVKLDVSKGQLEDCTVGRRIYGAAGCYGGEPFFVAKEPGNPEAEEDDGYVLSFVHNENNGESSLLVMDAKSANLDVVAEVKLPQRVPYGFHGLFVTEDCIQLAKRCL
ncbi:hypothetical protein PTKIN_Ptkin04bG0240600 [Pterospermum kingtungense]